MWHSGKEPAWPMQETHETQARSLGGEDPLEEETPPHSSILAWRMPWTEKPRRQFHPTPVFLPGECHGQRSPEGYSPWSPGRCLSPSEQGWAWRSGSRAWLAGSLDGPPAPAGDLSLPTTKLHAPCQFHSLRGPRLSFDHSAFSPGSRDAPAEQLGEDQASVSHRD